MAGEALVIANILKAFRKRGAWAVKIHGDAHQPKTVDILACYRGRFVAVEAKRLASQHATIRQRATLADIKKAEGRSGVAFSAEVALQLLDAIDEEIDAASSD